MLHDGLAFVARIGDILLQTHCIISTRSSRVLLYMETSKAWVYLFLLRQMFDWTNLITVQHFVLWWQRSLLILLECLVTIKFYILCEEGERSSLEDTCSRLVYRWACLLSIAAPSNVMWWCRGDQKSAGTNEFPTPSGFLPLSFFCRICPQSALIPIFLRSVSLSDVHLIWCVHNSPHAVTACVILQKSSPVAWTTSPGHSN